MIQPIHVMPIGDRHEHDSDGPTLCSCHPSVELIPRPGLLVVHSAWDKRELREVKART